MPDLLDRYPVVTVHWADHYSVFDQGQSESEVEHLVDTPCIRITTGHLIKESRRQIAIASTVDEDESGTVTFTEVFVCMKRAILKRSDRK